MTTGKANTSFRFDPELKRMAQIYALKNNTNLTKLINKAMNEYLNKQP